MLQTLHCFVTFGELVERESSILFQAVFQAWQQKGISARRHLRGVVCASYARAVLVQRVNFRTFAVRFYFTYFLFFVLDPIFFKQLFSMIPARMTAKFGATGVDNDREQESEFFFENKGRNQKLEQIFNSRFFFPARYSEIRQCCISDPFIYRELSFLPTYPVAPPW